MIKYSWIGGLAVALASNPAAAELTVRPSNNQSHGDGPQLRGRQFPLGFMIIDAGWQDATPGNILSNTLRGFEADATKIPGGLKALVADLRHTTGAQWIGVLHSLQGTPAGVDPKSPLAKAEAAHLWRGNHPGLIPDPTSNRGADFFQGRFPFPPRMFIHAKKNASGWAGPYDRSYL